MPLMHPATGSVLCRGLRACAQSRVRPEAEPIWRHDPKRRGRHRHLLAADANPHRPGSPGYGNAIFGLHLYTWAFIAFALMIVGCAVLLLDDRQFARSEPWSTRLSVLPLTAFALLFVLAVGNVISTVLICGAGLCPEVPAGYLIFNDNLRLTDLAQSP